MTKLLLCVLLIASCREPAPNKACTMIKARAQNTARVLRAPGTMSHELLRDRALEQLDLALACTGREADFGRCRGELGCVADMLDDEARRIP